MSDTMKQPRRQDKNLAGNGGEFTFADQLRSPEPEAVLTVEPKATRQTNGPIKRLSLEPYNCHAEKFWMNAKSGDLEINPPYQRGSVWSEDQRINLVKSWMQGIPVPAIMVNVRRDWPGITVNEPWDALVDGKQRVETAIAWFEGEFGVPASWFDPEYVDTTEETDDGPYVRFTGLSPVGQRFSRNRSMLPCIESQVGSIEEEAELYLLVNTGGTDQTEGDLANAALVAGR